MRAAKIDGNQQDLFRFMEILGATVTSTAPLGNGFPDALIGFRGVNYLAEIKDPAQPPSKRKLRPKQIKFHGTWRGHVTILQTTDDCLRMLGLNPCNAI